MTVAPLGVLRPLLVIGKGAAYSQADGALRALVESSCIPFLATAMGRGVVPDSHALNVNPARSAALAGADVAVIFGARCVEGPCCGRISAASLSTQGYSLTQVGLTVSG